MSILYRQICNMCGKWGEEGESAFVKIEIDLSYYLLFSAGIKLREPKAHVDFCRECYSQVIDLSFRYQTGEEVARLGDQLSAKDKEISELKATLRNYKSEVETLLKPLENK